MPAARVQANARRLDRWPSLVRLWLHWTQWLAGLMEPAPAPQGVAVAMHQIQGHRDYLEDAVVVKRRLENDVGNVLIGLFDGHGGRYELARVRGACASPDVCLTGTPTPGQARRIAWRPQRCGRFPSRRGSRNCGGAILAKGQQGLHGKDPAGSARRVPEAA